MLWNRVLLAMAASSQQKSDEVWAEFIRRLHHLPYKNSADEVFFDPETFGR